MKENNKNFIIIDISNDIAIVVFVAFVLLLLVKPALKTPRITLNLVRKLHACLFLMTP